MKILLAAVLAALGWSPALADTDTFTHTVTSTSTSTSTSTVTATSTPTATTTQTSSSTRTATCAANCFAYVAVERGIDLSVINTTVNSVSGTVRNIGYGSNGIVFGGTTGYVSQDTGFLKVVNTSTNKVTGGFGLGVAPQQVAIAPNGSILAVPSLGDDEFGAVHVVEGTHVTEVQTGNMPFACAFSPNGSWLYVTDYNSGADSTVAVVNVATRALRTKIPVGRGARYVDFAYSGSYAYVANEQSGNVSVVNVAQNRVVATVQTGGSPYFVTANNAKTFVTLRNSGGGVATITQSSNAFVFAATGDRPTFCVTKAKSGSDNEGWVANTQSATVKHFTGTTVNRNLSTGTGTHPLHIAWATNDYTGVGEILYVTLYDRVGKVLAVKPSDDSLLATLSVGPFPKFVALKP